jgi:phage/plasmid-associated DNA primase
MSTIEEFDFEKLSLDSSRSSSSSGPYVIDDFLSNEFGYKFRYFYLNVKNGKKYPSPSNNNAELLSKDLLKRNVDKQVTHHVKSTNKDIILVPNRTKEHIKNSNCFQVFLVYTNWVVIDIDEAEWTDEDYEKNLPSWLKKCIYTIGNTQFVTGSTTGGRHYFVKLKEEKLESLRTKSNPLVKVFDDFEGDVLGFGVWEMMNKPLFNYNPDDIIEHDFEIIKEMLNKTGLDMLEKKSSINKKELFENMEEEKVEKKIKDTPKIEAKDDLNIEEETRIIQCLVLRCLSDVRITNFTLWCKVGFAIKNSCGKYGLDLFVLFSSKKNEEGEHIYKKFTYNECIDFYNKIHIREVGGLSRGSIHLWSIEDNYVEYRNIMKDSTSIMNNITNEDYFNCHTIEILLKMMYGKNIIRYYGNLRVFNGSIWVIDKKDDKEATEMVKQIVRKDIYGYVKNIAYEKLHPQGIAATQMIKESDDIAKERKNNRKILAGDILNKKKKRNFQDNNEDEDGGDGVKEQLMFMYKKYEKVMKYLNRLQSYTIKLAEELTTSVLFRNGDIIFDNNPNLLPFKNMVYNLEEGKWHQHKREFLITKYINYDWEEPSEEDYVFLKKMIAQILPIKEHRDFYFLHLSTALSGYRQDKVLFAKGKGRNGKGIINTLVKEALSSAFASKGTTALLYEKLKLGACPELSNLANMRFAYFQELTSGQDSQYGKKVQTGFLKEITGGDDLKARNLFSSEDNLNCSLTLVAETNEILSFEGPKDDRAIRDRFFYVPFNSYFTDNADDVDEENNVFLKNRNFDKPEFRNKFKYAMMKILMEYYEKYLKMGIIVPQSIRDISTNEMKDELDEWLEETIEKTEDRNDFIKLKDLYEEYKESDDYALLSNSQKRLKTKARFADSLVSKYGASKNNIYGFYDRQIKINGNNERSILLGYKLVNSAPKANTD